MNYQKKPVLQYETWDKYQNKKLLSKDFSGYVKFLKSQTKGLNLPKGYVPHTVYWLVGGQKFIGLLMIRHRLTAYTRKFGGHIGYEIAKKFQSKGYGKLILKLGLKKAKLMRINNVLMTCDATNLRSKKVIQVNGGKYEGKSAQGKNKPMKLRYWITVN